MIIKGFKNYFFTFIVPRFYGGGGAPSQNTTVQQRNIPTELKPYYEILLNSMTKQAFTTKENPGPVQPKITLPETEYATQQKFANGGEVRGYAGDLSSLTALLGKDTAGKLGVTGIQPYQMLGQDAKTGGLDLGKYVAPSTALQGLSYSTAANLSVPEQTATGSDLAASAGAGGLDTADTSLAYGQHGYNAGLNAADFGNTAAKSGAQYAAGMTDSGTVSSYMNPYLDASLQPQLDLLQQQNDITKQKNNSAAAQAGAYGGSRQAVQNALSDQGNALAEANVIGQGYNKAFDTAQGNMGKAADINLQGLQAGIAGQGAAMQGANAGLAGVGAAQAGYGLAGSQGQNIANIGNTQLGQQQAIAGMQNSYGAQLQALDQQKLNTAINANDYQQKYPWEILGGYANALNGVQVGNVSEFKPSPSPLSQYGGLAASALGAYGANGGFKNNKKGGVIKKPKAQGSGIGDLAVYNTMKGGR
jgi:hypothetical protein